jgi:hypothetical protein
MRPVLIGIAAAALFASPFVKQHLTKKQEKRCKGESPGAKRRRRCSGATSSVMEATASDTQIRSAPR